MNPEWLQFRLHSGVFGITEDTQVIDKDSCSEALQRIISGHGREKFAASVDIYT